MMTDDNSFAERPFESRPQNRIAADLIIEKDGGIVLIKRRFAPYKDLWCLPGGHVEHGEQVVAAAKREAKEETGLDIAIDELFGIYDEPGRDPRGPIISIVYTATPKNGDASSSELAADTDAAEARWFLLDDLPDELGFDHEKILGDYLSHRERIR